MVKRKYCGGALNLLTVSPYDYANFYPDNPPPLPPRPPPKTPPRQNTPKFSSILDEIKFRVPEQSAIDTSGYSGVLDSMREKSRTDYAAKQREMNSSLARFEQPSLSTAFNIADMIKKKFNLKTPAAYVTEKPKVGRLKISDELKNALGSIYVKGKGKLRRKRKISRTRSPKEMKMYMAYVRSFRKRRA